MSAIWGIIDFSGRSICSEDCAAMEQPFHGKKINKIQSLCRGNVFMACGLQFVNDEASQENYPYHDGDSTLVADAIIDNRIQLQHDFTMRTALSQDGIDGSILFDCVQQDLNKALDTMLGAYVFARYSRQANSVTLANDVAGTRSVYYMVQDSRFYFSSLLESLLHFVPSRKPNNKWLFNFFAQDSLRFVNEAHETPYENIFRLEPGELLIFGKSGLQRKAYWDPLANRKELKLASHEEYVQRVRDVFSAAVERTIRGDRDVGILLSGGLDSNAVAAFAAPRLKQYGKKLCSFTSVPDEKNAIPVSREYYVPDERSYVELLQKKHSNLEPVLVGCNQYDYLEQCRSIMEFFEIPFKTVPNMPWLFDSYCRAAGKGCGILLTGQYGNITISFGGYENLFETLLKHGRLAELYRQVCAYGKAYRKGRRWVYRTIWSSIWPHSSDFCSKSDLSPEIYKTHSKELRELSGNRCFFPDAMEHVWHYMYDKVALRQVGESELKISLETGVIPRDPTRDKYLIELVLSLPIEEFVWNGMDRRLVRQDMEGLVPDEIAKDVYHRGCQAVGSQQNLRDHWPVIRKYLRNEFLSGHAKDFLNLPYLLEQLDNPEILKEKNNETIVRMMYCGLCSEFIGKSYD